MSLPLPTSLSPSKVASFKDCGLAFRFSAIDRLPEPSSPWAVKGTLVHRALQLLFWDHAAADRTPDAALACLERAWEEAQADPEFIGLALPVDEAAKFLDDAEVMVARYFDLEDPRKALAVGVELRLEVRVGTLTLRGIIDRLDIEDGELVVTDYKTGRSPSVAYEQGRLGGVHFYAYLCEQVIGRRPSKIRLIYLGDGVTIEATPSEQSIRGLQRRTTAIWTAVERACEREDFRPRPSKLCDFCAYRSYCPAWGGDPTRAIELRQTPETPARVA